MNCTEDPPRVYDGHFGQYAALTRNFHSVVQWNPEFIEDISKLQIMVQ